MEKITELRELLEQLQHSRVFIEDSESFCLLNEVEIYLDHAESELLNIISEIEDGDDYKND